MPANTDESEIILDVFIQKLVKEKGYGQLEPEVEDEMKTMAMDSLRRTIFAQVLSDLNGTQRESFERLLAEEGDGDEIRTFLESAIPDYPNYLARILLEFRRSYLG